MAPLPVWSSRCLAAWSSYPHGECAEQDRWSNKVAALRVFRPAPARGVLEGAVPMNRRAG